MNYKDVLPIILNSDLATNEMITECIRGWRNCQLAASDWTQLSDVDLTNKSDWAVYRQELRDMMNKGVPPKEIVFPTPPV